MLRLLRSLHAWAGAFLSLLLVVLGLSGTLLVFKKDYVRLVIPEARQSVSLAPENVATALNAIEGQFGREDLRYVLLAEPGFALHKVMLHGGGAAYTDQSGSVVAQWQKNGRFEEWLFDLHHYLLAGTTGKTIAGLAGLAAVLMIITGLIITMPLLRRFAWRIWPRTAARRDLLEQHRDLGIIFAIPLALFTLTGAAIVFSAQAKSILAAVTFSQPKPFERPIAEGGAIDWLPALTNAQAQFPSASMRIVSWPRSGNAPLSIRMRQPMEWHQNGRTYVFIDPATSRALAAKDAQRLSLGERAFHAIYPLHSAGIGGRWYDFATALSGLVLAILGCGGLWTFSIRLYRTRARQRRGAHARFGDGAVS